MFAQKNHKNVVLLVMLPFDSNRFTTKNYVYIKNKLAIMVGQKWTDFSIS